MKLENNTIVLTGGSSGIGLELSKQLIERSNKVIICGRSKERLARAKEKVPELITFACNLSDPGQCDGFAKWIVESYPEINVLINNAAVVTKIDFRGIENTADLAENEVQANFLAPIRLIKRLHNTLKKNQDSAIINITSGLIYAPRAIYPFYNATKAALHSFTQTLRINLRDEPIKVIEVMFPAVDTPWHQGKPPKIAISPKVAVDEMLIGLQKNKNEIRVKGVRLLYLVSRIAPGFALKKVNQLQ